MTQSLSTARPLAGQPGDDAFGGRQQEGEAVLQAHARLVDHGGGTLLLVGPRGAGKGTLTDGLRRSLALGGKGPVFAGSAAAQHRPYAVVADALRPALVHLDTLGVGYALRQIHGGVLSILDPALVASASGWVQPATRFGLLEGTRALVADVLNRTHGTLVLADLDAADEDTCGLGLFLAEHLVGPGAIPQGVLVITTAETPAVAALVSTLRSRDNAETVRVGNLDRDGLLRFLRTSHAVDNLLNASGGRPADVAELLAALPLNMDSLLEARLNRLGARVRSVADALCICEAPMAVDALCALAGSTAVHLAPLLASLTEEGLVRRQVANGALLFSLARPAHAERLSELLSEDQRRALHLALARHLEAKGAALMEDGDLHLAEHFLAAGDGTAGLPYALAAVERLTVTHAYGAAADLLDQALPLAPDGAARLQLLQRRCEVRHLQGQLVQALADAGRIKSLTNPLLRGPVYLQLGELLNELGKRRTAIKQLQRSLALSESAPAAERSAVLAALAAAYCGSGDMEGALVCIQRAQGGTPAGLARIRLRSTRGKVALAQEAWADATAAFQGNAEEARSLGLVGELTRAEINLGVTAFRQARYDAAEEHYGRALQLAKSASDLPNHARCAVNLGALRQQRGDLAGALRHNVETLALVSRLGNHTEMLRARSNLANVCLLVGDLEQAARHLDQGERDARDHGLVTQEGYLWALRGDLFALRSQWEDARGAYTQARNAYVGSGERSRAAEQWLRLAQVAIRLQDWPGAEEALAHVSAATLHVSHPAIRVEVLVAQARLAMAPGTARPDAAAWVATLLGEARTLATEAGGPESLALVLFAESESWLARGDNRRAERLHAQGRDILHKGAAELPPALRDGFVRSRVAILAGPAGTPRAPVPEGAPTEPVAEAPEAAGPRSDAWDKRYPDLVGRSPALIKVLGRLDRLHGSLAPVLIRGESGTGKELVANALHHASPRAGQAFVKVNCAALVETLLLSELFGHEKGSFTGAHTRKVGRFELARGGTIFLDEIGDVSPNTQVALLRVLQEKVFERVGGSQPIKADCRVICATNRNLESMVKQGTFREDLYYRLKGIQVELPTLRQRREDIPLLVDHVLARACADMGRTAPVVSPGAMEALTRYTWPGNIRELENALRSIVLFVDGEVLDVEHLSEFKELRSGATPPRESANAALPLGQMKKKLEFDAISGALVEAQGNISRAADLLQMKRPRLSQIVNGNPELRAIKNRFKTEGGEA